MDTLYPSIEDALGIAAENMAARRELARRGPDHVIIADVVRVAGGFHLLSVAVEAWATWSPAPTRHVVRESSGVGEFVFPVCDREGRVTGGWSNGVATGSIVSGLNEANCAGCHDTLTSRGVVPSRLKTGEPAEPVPRPEQRRPAPRGVRTHATGQWLDEGGRACTSGSTRSTANLSAFLRPMTA